MFCPYHCSHPSRPLHQLHVSARAVTAAVPIIHYRLATAPCPVGPDPGPDVPRGWAGWVGALGLVARVLLLAGPALPLCHSHSANHSAQPSPCHPWGRDGGGGGRCSGCRWGGSALGSPLRWHLTFLFCVASHTPCHHLGSRNQARSWPWTKGGGEGGPHYSASPVSGWCASDCVSIAQAVPYPPPLPLPLPLPSFSGWVLGSPGSFILAPPVLCRHRQSLLLSSPSWALVYVCGLRLFAPRKFRCVASCSAPCRHRSHTPPT